MDQTLPPRSDSHACLGAALGKADAALEALEALDRGRADWTAHMAVWGAWLQWMLRLLAFELALAWGDPCPQSGLARDEWGTLPSGWPQGDDCMPTARPVTPRALERKITRLLEAAAHVREFGHPPAARPLRRLRRRPMLRDFSRIGARERRLCAAHVITSDFLGERVLALCKP
jgi:hypothetical protein